MSDQRQPAAHLFYHRGMSLLYVSLSPEFRAWMAPASAWQVIPLVDRRREARTSESDGVPKT